MRFDTKIAVVVREDLAPWQKMNVTAFLVSGIARTVADIVGEPYVDGSGNQYLPMFGKVVDRIVDRAPSAFLGRPAVRPRSNPLLTGTGRLGRRVGGMQLTLFTVLGDA